MSTFSHFDDHGTSRMVDVGDKEITPRVAVARGVISMQANTLRTIRSNETAKGNVLEVARLAGIMAAKQTSNLIPLCHQLPLDSVKIDFSFPTDTNIEVRATTKIRGKTGVEMESLTAVSISCLTIYDMCKAVDRGMIIGRIELLKKEGGKSGPYEKADETPQDLNTDREEAS